MNELGFDPILKMPDFETFAGGVMKRKVFLKGDGVDLRYLLRLCFLINRFLLGLAIGLRKYLIRNTINL